MKAKMKFYIYMIALLLTTSGCQNKISNYGDTPVQLQNIPMKIDIPQFLSDESIFNGDNDKVSLDAEEKKISWQTDNGEDSSVYFIQYGMRFNQSDINLARYNNFKFKSLELLTDVDEKEIWVWMAEQEKVSTDDIAKLFDQINADLEIATVQSKDLTDHSPFSSTLKFVWRTPDKVIKLVVNDAPNLELEYPDDYDHNNWEYDENGNMVEKKYEEIFTKDQLIEYFKKSLQQNTGNYDISLFIADPKFDYWFQKNRSSSGTMTRY